MSDYNLLRASDGTGNPVLAHITANRAIGATVIETDGLDNWDDEFIVTTGTLLGTNFIDPDTVTEMTAHRDGTDIVIDGFEPGFVDDGNTEGQVAVIKQTAGWANSMVENAQVAHNDDGTLKNSAVKTALDSTNDLDTGWNAVSALPTATTYLGNRSYQHTYAASILGYKSPGMRNRYTRTISAPIRCTDLEASSSQYYSKSSPSGMTFTDDFVVSAWVKLESYAQMAVASRYNGTSGWYMRINSSGQVALYGHNAGAANHSEVISVQSLPLGKWVHVAAQLDMSAFTATTTTSYIMFDGLDVPATVARTGTNPTALIQAGDLQIGADNGTNFFDGKAVQVAVYGAKVTQANIRATIAQGLSGSETSLVSAYSFNNSINDLNTSNANNLTANGGAVATSSDSPFAQDAYGAPVGTTDYSITQYISSDGLTEVVQVPEGNTLPTAGGIDALAYSMMKSPQGFIGTKAKWQVENIDRRLSAQSAPGAATWYNLGGSLSVPAGDWELYYQAAADGTRNAANSTGTYKMTLSTGSSSESDVEMTARWRMDLTSASGNNLSMMVHRRKEVSLSANTTYYLNLMNDAGIAAISFVGTDSPNIIRAVNAYL